MVVSLEIMTEKEHRNYPTVPTNSSFHIVGWASAAFEDRMVISLLKTAQRAQELTKVLIIAQFKI